MYGVNYGMGQGNSQEYKEKKLQSWNSSIKSFRESSVQFSLVAQLCPTLRPHESQHARFPCQSPAPGVYPTHVRIEAKNM